MSNKEKALLVPKLRFAEFRDIDGWRKVRLIDTTDRAVKWSFIGGPFGSNLKSSDYVNAGVRIIQLQNIGDGEFWDDYRIFTSLEKADELQSNNIYPGDIIISKMGDPVGRACLIPNLHDRYVMCSDGIRLVVDEKTHNKYFIYSLINSPLFRSTVEKAATGSTRKRIGLDELKNLPMRVPIKTEQQKIADCLSSLDDLIAAQARKVAALKSQRKGLLQQLFPREGETQPLLRLPKFRNVGKWRLRKLERLLLETPRPIAMDDETKYSLVTVKRRYGGVVSREILEGKAIKVKSQFVVRTNDFLISKRQIVHNACGLVPTDLEGAIVSNEYSVLTAKKGCSVEFINHFAQQPSVSQSFLQASVGIVIEKMLFKLDFWLKKEFPFPEFEEQQCIADCLASLDTLITTQIQRLETLKTHKRGLMQQLFPSVDAIEA